MLERPSGILCDEMGLGKTIQLLGLIRTDKKKNTLLIAPLAVLQQWATTGTKARINCWSATKEGTWKPPADLRLTRPNLFLVNYETAVRKNELFTERVWNRVICDEAHRLAKKKSASWIRVDGIPTPSRWLLTATPIVNRMSDLEALLELCGKTYSQETLKEVILCRTMAEMRASLPELPKQAKQIEHILDFETEKEMEFYRGIQGLLVSRWRRLRGDGDNAALEKLQIIMKLRQISLHPQVYIEGRKKIAASLGLHYERQDWIDPSTKFSAARDLIEKEAPTRWILFCHFHKEMELLEQYLKFSDSIGSVWCYSGALSQQERTRVLQETEAPLNGKHQVLLCQLQSGGTGLNLQHFSRIVFSGPWWTSALMEQAIGRAVRIGQTEQVVVHHLILKEEQGLNIDRLMKTKAETKGKLCQQVLAHAAHLLV
jgi:hypothetical protein